MEVDSAEDLGIDSHETVSIIATEGRVGIEGRDVHVGRID